MSKTKSKTLSLGTPIGTWQSLEPGCTQLSQKRRTRASCQGRMRNGTGENRIMSAAGNWVFQELPLTDRSLKQLVNLQNINLESAYRMSQ
ncbi:hypothetical protein ElyMa_002356100 [Elysia marginata]|uniref:Uncharacterized protein n=1 Tax=Elysia marginata TaxID=1093978 RepID=A0AAV4G8F9_9GAST|nr:hypothetical protein ElyMa_002356100 [Elysia marginata]